MEVNSLRHRVPVTHERAFVPGHKRTGSQHPAGPAKHGTSSEALRAVGLLLYFFVSCISIFVTQLLGCGLYWVDKDYYYAWMAVTKQHFGLLIITITQWWSPTVVRVSGDASVRGQLHRTADGRLECTFPERAIIIANHQIYTDWLYLWWIAYTNRMHGHLYIIMKESLKYIPLLGWGMQFFSFVFLSRHWSTDKPRFSYRLHKLNARHHGPMSGSNELDPMWLLLFPEGTNLSKNGRAKSAAWAEKSGQKDLRHVLIPRATGMLFCLREMKDTVEWVYDCTMAYEGIPRDEYGQDIFTIRSTFFQGRPPKSVNLHWRRFHTSTIPIDDDEKFDEWIRERWREKDEIAEVFVQTGRFPGDEGVGEDLANGAVGDKSKGVGHVETAVSLTSPLELLQIYAPAATLWLLVYQVRKFWRLLLMTLYLRK